MSRDWAFCKYLLDLAVIIENSRDTFQATQTILSPCSTSNLTCSILANSVLDFSSQQTFQKIKLFSRLVYEFVVKNLGLSLTDRMYSTGCGKTKTKQKPCLLNTKTIPLPGLTACTSQMPPPLTSFWQTGQVSQRVFPCLQLPLIQKKPTSHQSYQIIIRCHMCCTH